jgi:accessory gene regulator protein AgrB
MAIVVVVVVAVVGFAVVEEACRALAVFAFAFACSVASVVVVVAAAFVDCNLDFHSFAMVASGLVVVEYVEAKVKKLFK